MVEKGKLYSSVRYVKLYAGLTTASRAEAMVQYAVREALGELPVILEEGTYKFEVSMIKESDYPEPTK